MKFLRPSEKIAQKSRFSPPATARCVKLLYRRSGLGRSALLLASVQDLFGLDGVMARVFGQVDVVSELRELVRLHDVGAIGDAAFVPKAKDLIGKL